ncbi:MAG: ATP-binding protein [Caldisericia bacterium]|nr:ATP-binding protein [Caldisericia bacterium]
MQNEKVLQNRTLNALIKVLSHRVTLHEICQLRGVGYNVVMMIPRYFQDLNTFMRPNKALVIYGPRQVGKTTLLKNWLKTVKEKVRFVIGDNIDVQRVLSSNDLPLIQDYVSGFSLLVIDEAQNIPNIGQNVKIMIDQIPNLKIILTGSSSLELAGQIGEPLVGRKKSLLMFPISQLELKTTMNNFDLRKNNEEYILYGGYPEVVTENNKKEKQLLLEDIANSYLLKDILVLDKVKRPKVLVDLLRLLAFQIGGEVSLSELSSNLRVDTKTVIRYLDLMQKSFILYNLRGFSRNLRKEVNKKSKYYFYDNGVRNALINNFNPLSMRNDVGQLWENFLFMERMKKRSYENISANIYFWRTWDQKEIDLIEDRDGILHGYEFKLNSIKLKSSKLWKETYPDSKLEIINQENYLDFII